MSGFSEEYIAKNFDQWREWSRTDDRFQHFVLSDIRMMLGEIERLRLRLAASPEREPECWMVRGAEAVRFFLDHDEATRTALSWGGSPVIPLFAALPEREGWRTTLLQEAVGIIKELTLMGRTSGGTAGRDENLCTAMDAAEAFIEKHRQLVRIERFEPLPPPPTKEGG